MNKYNIDKKHSVSEIESQHHHNDMNNYICRAMQPNLPKWQHASV